MRVLIVSHNVLCRTTSMGKTLISYFEGIDNLELAQFYIHSEVPTDHICENYYRITDKEAIKSVFTRRSGCVLGADDIKEQLANPRTDTGKTANLYQKARKRTPLIYLLRNSWWKFGAWKTGRLKKWLDDFDPDVVFFASGDYAFMYKIALKIAKYKKIPLVVSCMDDYYFHNKNSDSFLGRTVHRSFMKNVKKTVAASSCILSICDKMTCDYSAFFKKECYTLHTPSSFVGPLSGEKKNSIAYIGNLGYKRHEQLVSIGKALVSIENDAVPKYIDVYSAESRPEILKDLTLENGICFRGKISSDEVRSVMASSTVLLHTESFDENTRRSVAYSVSTKIAYSLASGTCLLAYGPSEIASIRYLSDNNAAWCVSDEKDLEKSLVDLFSNEVKRGEIINNAVSLASANHNSTRNCGLVYSVLSKYVHKED